MEGHRTREPARLRTRRLRRTRPVETPRQRAERRYEKAHEAFLDSRDDLRAVLEDLIEAETRALCPTATDLEVEVYFDKLNAYRARLIAVNADETRLHAREDLVREAIGELLGAWAETANLDSMNIYFHQPPTPASPAPG
jgi:hypothetical protein